MKLEYMLDFLELADTLNFSTAAKRRFISQSTLSRRIQGMENEFGMKMVKATSHEVELTPFGKQAQNSFRKMVKLYDQLLLQGKNITEQYSGTLHLGLLYYAVDDYCSDFLSLFQKKYPNIKLKCHSYLPDQLYADIKSGKMDIGSIFTVSLQNLKDLQYQHLNYFSMVAMMRKDHPLAKKPYVTLDQLKDEIIIDLESDSYSTTLTDLILNQEGHFSKRMISDNIETVPWTIRDQGGIHITGESCRRQNATGIAYVPIKFLNMKSSFGFACIKEHKNQLIDLFFEEAKNYWKK